MSTATAPAPVPAPAPPVIELRGLAKTYRTGLFHQKKVQSVRDVDLEVHRGEIFGFLGPNGAGKTTIIKMLVGLLRPTAGTARILGRQLPDREVQRQIGFLPEVASFYEYLTGLELLEFHARLLGIPAARRREKVAELVERVGMTGRADRQLRKFSKGMVQRIGLAQALLGEPRFLVLDEPMSGLDPLGRHDVREIILEEQRRGTTVFFSSHILPDVEQLCDRIGILVAGTLRNVGRVEEIRGEQLLAQEVILHGWHPALLADVDPAQLVEVRHHGPATTVVLQAEAPLDPVLQAILSGGGHVLEVKRHLQSLEDLFLREAKGNPR